MSLLDSYNAWVSERTQNEVGGDDDAWAESDGIAVDLLGHFAEAYEDALRAASNVIASWEQGDLAGAVNDLRMALELDCWSSASRQHYIDTGRYLQHGEAEVQNYADPEPGSDSSAGEDSYPDNPLDTPGR